VKWNPRLGGEKSFGIWALICGTMWITAIAMVIALPLGLVTAIYLSEFAPARVRDVLKPVLEILAGIPTVVYGFFALTTITPALQWFDDEVSVYNALAAGIAVGILCLPTVCSLSEDALRAVPRSLRDGAFGLGGTRFDVAVKVVVPAALSGVISAFLLAVARAIGETMIVALAAGSRAHVTWDPREDVQTMTGYMVQIATGDVSTFDLAYYSLYAVGFTLFLMTLTLTMVGNLVRKKFREKYE
jgi:phosphate transport system permease protein